VLGTTYIWWEEDDFTKARKVIKNVPKALRNALDCEKGGIKDPEYPKPDFSKPIAEYPPCFFNIERAKF